ncbi:hypothetical protein cyc_01813 [Cyclospora cayetanensis]|uniref:Tr-type G domain-containing protein n=1 Tax=Cyclospora cayetanensis TaxID=88456 RepID=A0A1D3CSM2_9EIME|nr:hypothetical protein cyc_01813 [Cyclospora cayetanensis]
MSKSSLNSNAPVFIPGQPFMMPAAPAAEERSKTPLLTQAEQPAAASAGAPQQQVALNELCSGMEAATLNENEHSWDEEDDSIEAEKATPGETSEPDASPPPMEGEAEETAAPGVAPGKSAKMKPDPRPHLNIVFIGHVDAGKSTTCGNILYLTGGVDSRTIEKYEREAKEKNRDSWFLAFVMDTNEEERQKGKTVEVGRAYFSTPNRRFTLLDAPGHKAFVPNMIEGSGWGVEEGVKEASLGHHCVCEDVLPRVGNDPLCVSVQADIGVLIISSRKGEFETGFEKGGQTREHTLLAKTLGVCQLVVAVNKMDESTCQWNEERYREIIRKTKAFFQGCGFVLGKNLVYIPISGLAGQNLKCHVSRKDSPCFDAKASWYSAEEPTLFEVLDGLTPPPRKPNAALRIPILDGYKDNGVTALGKVEAGTVTFGMTVVLMPNKKRVKVSGIYIDEDDVGYASVGENVRIKLLGCEEDALYSGAVLCCPEAPCPVASKILAYVKVMELLEHRPLLTAGYTCIMHVHTAREEVMLGKLHESSDGKKKKTNPQFVKSDCLVSIEILCFLIVVPSRGILGQEELSSRVCLPTCTAFFPSALVDAAVAALKAHGRLLPQGA